MIRNERTYKIGSLERALLILDVLAEVGDISLVELAQWLHVPKGSLFRHLKVLEARGYVRQASQTKRYSLGSHLIYLGFAAREHLRLPELAAPFMRELRDRFKETVHLGVLSQGEVVHVGVVESTHPVKMAAAVGDRTWAHVSALGKALLAWGDAAAVEVVLRERGLPPLTERTIVTRGELEAELARTRARGYSIDDEESAIGLRCVAAPIRNEEGVVVAALSVSSPSERLPLEKTHALAPAIVEAAGEIANHLGWREQVRERREPDPTVGGRNRVRQKEGSE